MLLYHHSNVLMTAIGASLKHVSCKLPFGQQVSPLPAGLPAAAASTSGLLLLRPFPDLRGAATRASQHKGLGGGAAYTSEFHGAAAARIRRPEQQTPAPTRRLHRHNLSDSRLC